MSVACYDKGTCVMVDELCSSCKRNTGLDEAAGVVDHYEAKKGTPCPDCGKPLVAAMGDTRATFCWYCNKNLREMEAEKRR